MCLGLALADRVIVDAFSPFLAGKMIFLELFTNFLIKLSARSLTKFLEILEIELCKFSLHSFNRWLKDLRVDAGLAHGALGNSVRF